MCKSKEQEKVLKVTTSGEILFWLIIISLFVGIYSISAIFKDKIDENDYQIFLQDVDGLIVGSPVRMMGIEVGHVTQIKPMQDEVFVNFIITKPDVYIPQGSSITVEFSGMAGSKSLEVYLPQENDYIDSQTPILRVNSPKRLHDALGLLNEMFKKLGSIMYTTSDFGSKIQSEVIEPAKEIHPENNIEDFIKISDKFLYESKEKTTEIREKLGGLESHAK